MRARNREVNIFNMSLLDILCGALGAFCFMMLTLFPHYGKGEGQTPTPQARRGRSAPGSPGYTKQLEQQVEQLNRDLGKAQETINTRDPIAVQVWWNGGSHDVDLYVRERFGAPGKMAPMPDPSRKQNPNWNGDVRSDVTATPGSEVWCMRDTPLGEYEIYLKLMDTRPDPPALALLSILTTKGVNHLNGIARLSRDHRIYLVGVMKVSGGHKVDFFPSNQFKEEVKRGQ